MSEPTPETPVTESAPPTEAKPVVSSKGGDRRAAAMAALPEDMSAADRAEAKAPPPEADEPMADAAPVVEPPKAEEPPKPSEVPDALAARAAADRFLMREREALKAEREAIAKERQEWEAQRKEVPDPGEVETRIHRTIAADIVAFADAQKWTPQQRFEMAKALSWSNHPNDPKRPADWRGSGQGQVMSEVEQVKAELARVKAEQEKWQKSQQEQAEKAQAAQRDAQLGDSILKALPSDTPYVKAKAEHSPDEVRAHLAHFAKQMIAAEKQKAHEEFRDPRILTEADVAKEYERYLTEEYNQKWGWREKVQRPAPAKPATPAQVPPAKALASATPPAPKVNSRISPQERAKAKAEAMALLPEKLD